MYELKWQRIFEVAKNLPSGSIADVDVLHDDDCPAIRTGRMGDCTCQPEIKLRERVEDALRRYEKKKKRKRNHCPALDAMRGINE